MKIQIEYERFIDWYFNEDDAQWLLQDVKHFLMNKKKYELDGLELFHECGYIPAFLRTDYDYKIHLNEEYDSNDCILI